MKKGTKDFSCAASAAYAATSQEEKDELRKRCSSSTRSLTAHNIKQSGKKRFKAIDRHVSLTLLLTVVIYLGL